MKLSEYIRKGMKETALARGSFIRQLGTGTIYACAMGAACYAKDPQETLIEGGGDTALIPAVATKLFPELNDFVTVPAETFDTMNLEYSLEEDKIALGDLIVALNDDAMLRRNRIANIVEKLGY